MSEQVRRRGRATPSWTLLGSVLVVAIAVLGFLITASPDRTKQAAGGSFPTSTPQTPQQSETPLKSPPDERPTTKPAEKPAQEPVEKPAEKLAEKPAEKAEYRAAKPRAYVEVFNNSTITGLAAEAADKLGGSGWDVVGTDDRYGDIPQSTVYYPQRLLGQAELLAGDLGTQRVMPAVDPMRLDRLTVILTGDL